jgi:membrane-bound lytic murein transglycosylase F
MASAYRLPAAILSILVLLASCGGGDDKTGPGEDSASRAGVPFTGDLDALSGRGVLRILVEREPETYLPRHGPALYVERELARRFAESRGLESELVFVDRFTDLLPALLEGRGDIAAANLTVTPERAEQVAFTDALDFSRERLVVAADAELPDDINALSGTIAARDGTTLLDTAMGLSAENPALTVITVDASVSNESVVDGVANGDYDYALQDGNFLETVLSYRDDVVAGPDLTEPRPLAWAVRPDNPSLLAALNAYLAEYQLLGEADPEYTSDLEGLRQRGRLRMITRNNAATYFLWRGELMGFEYELAKHFADEQNLRLEVVVAPSHDAMIPMLLEGRGDFVASYLAPTDERRAQGVEFTRPYHYASEVVVGRADEEPVEGLDGLAGRTFVVRESSAYWTHLTSMIESGALDAELVAAPADMETQEIIDAVADGRFDLTLADSHILAIEMTWRDDVDALYNMGDEQPHGWAVRPENPELLAAMNAYLRKAYRGLRYNISYAKYFENPRYVREEPDGLIAPGQISPYDELVRAIAPDYDFDWRVIVAQMYRESRFDPDARSWMGAVGLMQVLPRTAREFGLEDLEDPAVNVEAGIRYLDWVRERFPKRLDPDEQLWFALAGYNAGQGHVRDARRLAQRLGLDPDIWFDNVEQAMLKLEEPEYSKQARHGYVRGREPVQYVREIRDRFRAYSRLLADR